MLSPRGTTAEVSKISLEINTLIFVPAVRNAKFFGSNGYKWI